MRLSTIITLAFSVGVAVAGPVVNRDDFSVSGTGDGLPSFNDADAGGGSNAPSPSRRGITRREDVNPLDERGGRHGRNFDILVVCSRDHCRGSCWGYDLSKVKFHKCYNIHRYESVYLYSHHDHRRGHDDDDKHGHHGHHGHHDDDDEHKHHGHHGHHGHHDDDDEHKHKHHGDHDHHWRRGGDDDDGKHGKHGHHGHHDDDDDEHKHHGHHGHHGHHDDDDEHKHHGHHGDDDKHKHHPWRRHDDDHHRHHDDDEHKHGHHGHHDDDDEHKHHGHHGHHEEHKHHGGHGDHWRRDGGENFSVYVAKHPGCKRHHVIPKTNHCFNVKPYGDEFFKWQF